MGRVCWSDRGAESLLSIARHITEQTQSRQRGLHIISKVEAKAATYADFPMAGTARPDLGPGLRCFPVDKLVVIYRPIEAGMAIIWVAHGHQDMRTVVENIFGETADDEATTDGG